MSQKKIIDFLIIGQGLAGSIIANEISKRGYSFRIIDKNHENSASMAAGGIMHPMSFKRLIESWNSLNFIKYASTYYADLEKENGAQFFEPFNLKRPFGSIEEQNDWMGKMKQDDFKDWMGICNSEIKGINQPYGVGEVYPAGKVNIIAFLELIKTKFTREITTENFDFEKLEVTADHVHYNDQIYGKVIFCEGYQYINNPYFSYLPNNVTKGELIEIETKSLAREMISKGCFVAPHVEDSIFTVGSTYVWDCIDTNITDEGRKELTDKLAKVGVEDYVIRTQKCGIRPTTHDRRPLIGGHPIHPELFIFNGMGSKTVMMAPLLAKQLLDEIEGIGDVMEDASIRRLEKKHLHKYKAYEGAKM